MKLTESLKPANAENNWYVVDATDVPLGRLSTVIASHLRGKHKPSFTSHVDCGDNIVVVNADKVRLTGRKMGTMEFFWHTGFPGGIKSVIAGKELEGKHPERVVQRGVKRMLPKTKLGRAQFGRLYVYAGTEHPHTAQKPETLDVAGMVAKKNHK